MKTTFYKAKGEFESFETFSRLEADLKVSECITNNYSGYLMEIIKVENKEFPQCNKTTETMLKHW